MWLEKVVSVKTRMLLDKFSKMEDHQGVLAFWPEIHLEFLRFPWVSAGIDSFSTAQQM
jgi:hypothetical protein